MQHQASSYSSQLVESPIQIHQQIPPYSYPMSTFSTGATSFSHQQHHQGPGSLLPLKRKSMTETYVASHAGPSMTNTNRPSLINTSSSPLSIGHNQMQDAQGQHQNEQYAHAADRESSLEAANALAGMGQSLPMRASLSAATGGAAAGTAKKKKKRRKDGDDEDDGRRKTSRACDVCVSVEVVCAPPSDIR